MDGLACFAPGILALTSSDYGPADSQKFLSPAEKLAWTCFKFYQSTPPKLAGENYSFDSGQYARHRCTNLVSSLAASMLKLAKYRYLQVNTGVEDHMMQSFSPADTEISPPSFFTSFSCLVRRVGVLHKSPPLRIETHHHGEILGQREKQTIKSCGRKEGQFDTH